MTLGADSATALPDHGGAGVQLTLDLDGFVLKSWDELLAQGSIVSRRVTNREAAALLQQAGGPGVKPDIEFGKNPDDAYIDIFTGLATPPGISRNALGTPAYNTFVRPLAPGVHVIAVGSSGPYDFLGTRYYQIGRAHV